MPTILLTGASRGLGVLIATSFAKPGTHLVLAARSEEGLNQTAEAVRAKGATATVVPCDVSNPTDLQRLAEAAGAVDVLVHNAGIEQVVSAVEQDPAFAAKQIAVNLTGPIHLTRLIAPAMVARGSGTIVMISSMAGKSPTPFNAVYSATKYGLNGYAASLRVELDGTGVHVGTVCPGFVSGAGMWADGGHKAPAMFSEVPAERVVKAVHKVVAGKVEVLVSPSPIRPMLALAQLFPRLEGWVLTKLGVRDTMHKRALAENAGKPD